MILADTQHTDAQHLAQTLNLNPRRSKSSGYDFDITCPECGGGSRSRKDGVRLWNSGGFKCHFCSARGHLATYIKDPSLTFKSQAPERQTPKKDADPSNWPNALRELHELRKDGLKTARAWFVNKRGLPERFLPHFLSTEGVFCINPHRNYPYTSNLGKMRARRDVFFSLNDLQGHSRTAMTRNSSTKWLGSKSKCIATKYTGAGQYGGLWLGNIPEAKKKALILLVEGEVDWVTGAILCKHLGRGACIGVPGKENLKHTPTLAQALQGYQGHILAIPHQDAVEKTQGALSTLHKHGIRASMWNDLPFPGDLCDNLKQDADTIIQALIEQIQSLSHDLKTQTNPNNSKKREEVDPLLPEESTALATSKALEGSTHDVADLRAGSTLEELRDKLGEDVDHALKNNTTALIASACGVGKSTLITQIAQNHIQTCGKGTILIVAKDHHAMMTHHKAARGSIFCVGRSIVREETGEDWNPRMILGNTSSETVVSSCGNLQVLQAQLNGTRPPSCRTCPLYRTCVIKGGARKGREHAQKTKRDDGRVIVTTAPLLASVLERDIDPKHLKAIFFDDCPKPSPREMRKEHLEVLQYGKDIIGFLEKKLKESFDQARKGKAKHVSWCSSSSDKSIKRLIFEATGESIKGLLEAWIEDEKLLKEHTENHIPGALGDVIRALRENPNLIYFRTDPKGIALGVWPQQLDLPNVPSIVLSATASATFWRAYTRQPDMERLTSTPQLPEHLQGLHILSSAFAPETFDRGDWKSKTKTIQRALNPIRPQIQSIRDEVQRPLKALVIARQKTLKTNSSDQLCKLIIQSAGLRNEDTVAFTHWRSVAQVGSNEYQDFDVCITLGDPLQNLDSYNRECKAVGAWGGDEQAMQEAYKTNAAGLQEQAAGRIRPLQTQTPKLIVHVGRCVGDTLKRLSPTPMKTSVGRPAMKRQGCYDFLKSLGFDKAFSAEVLKIESPNKPSKSTLYECIQNRPKTWVSRKVKTGKKGHPVTWYGESQEAIDESIEKLNQINTLTFLPESPIRYVENLEGLSESNPKIHQTVLVELERGEVTCGVEMKGSIEVTPKESDPVSQSQTTSPRFKQPDGSRIDVRLVEDCVTEIGVEQVTYTESSRWITETKISLFWLADKSERLNGAWTPSNSWGALHHHARPYRLLLQGIRKLAKKRKVPDESSACHICKVEGVNHVWSMDFMHDQTEDEKALKILIMDPENWTG